MFRTTLRMFLASVVLAGCGGGGGGESISPTGVLPNTDLLPTWDAAKFPCPMAGVDVRRTGQSAFNGPASVSNVWSYTAAGGASINIQAVVTDQGIYFGTWGLVRKPASTPPDQWDKMDGRYYGLSLNGTELFPPSRPALVPAGYWDPARPRLDRDNYWLAGSESSWHVTCYNGTIEGTACIDPVSGLHYVGRGDGNLYAIDPSTGTVAWSFKSFNPQDAGEDGGGEIIGGPLLGPGRIIYFGTAGYPWPGSASDPGFETNAVYAVKSDGTLLWRYPSSEARLDNWILAPPALSPDGRTLYVGTFAGNVANPGRLIALDLTKPATASDAERIKWQVALRNTARAGQPAIWVRAITVGAEGRIYLGGAEAQFLGSSPVVLAFNPDGSYAWNPVLVEPQGYPAPAQWTGGLALRESGTPVLYASTTHNVSTNGSGGAVIAMNPGTGAILATFQPPAPAESGFTAPTIGANGTVYVGIRGKHPTGSTASVPGRMYALSFSGTAFTKLWEYVVRGQLDWVTPSIGADGGLYFGSTDDRLNANFLKGFFDPWWGPTEVLSDTSPIFYGIR